MRSRAPLVSRVRSLFSTSRLRTPLSRAMLAAAVLAPLGAVGIARGAGALGWRAPAPMSASASASDTVAVWGPRRLETPTGSSQTHIERLVITRVPGKLYSLRLTRDGSLTTGTVELNGARLAVAGDFSSVSELTRVIDPRGGGNDTLEVTVAGSAGAALTATVGETRDPSFLVFGPQQYTRTTGTPDRFQVSFSMASTAGNPYRMCIKNGTENGDDRLSSSRIWVNGVEVLGPNDLNQQVAGLIRDVNLQAENVVDIELRSNPGSFLTLCFTATDVTPPVLTVSEPAPNLITKQLETLAAGTVTDQTATDVTVNGQPAERTGTAFSRLTPLSVEGENVITVRAVDGAGLTTDSVRRVIRDTQAPIVTWTAPAEELITNQASLGVSGTIQDQTAVTANVNGVPLAIDAAGVFTGTVVVAEGVNFLTLTATDAAGNVRSIVRQVTLDTAAPVITVNAPADASTTTAETTPVEGTVADATAVTLTINGASTPVGAGGAFAGSVALAMGSNAISVVGTDAAGNMATATRTVTRVPAGPPLPPDPSTLAPTITRTEITPLGVATSFLYTAGADPIQDSVQAGAIDNLRAGVVRGRVLNKQLQPLSHVTVRVLGHAEYGLTMTRADGRYDLAINGGGELTLDFGRGGYLPAQRQISVPWREYTLVDDVVLLQPDAVVTVVQLGAADVQVARGSITTDGDGPRQATVIIPPGTTGTLVMPNGSTQPVISLSVRLTEYSVGAAGPLAMPAELPPMSAYTYAVQLSADEMTAAGARDVVLDRPVPFYVDDFLGMPVGMAVPVGAYDAARGEWVPEENGVVLKIVGETDGRADLDITGDGVADSDAALAAIGVDSVERRQLATTYDAGAQLWRARIRRFNWPSDLNYPPVIRGPMPTATVDAGCNGRTADVLACDVLAVSRSVPVTAMPFSLVYNGNRMPGHGPNRSLRVQLTDPIISPDLRRVDLQIEVAGRRIIQTFAPAANLTHTFTWDGLDVYGRHLQGGQPATVRVGHVYPKAYAVPAGSVRNFGLPCDRLPTTGQNSCLVDINFGDSTRREGTQWQTIHTTLGAFDVTEQGIGGFMPDVLHVYDPITNVMYAGDGSRRVGQRVPSVLSTVAGTGQNAGIPQPGQNTGDGGQARLATFGQVQDVAVAPDGTIYVVDGAQRVVRRIAPNGIITRFAGNQVNAIFPQEGTFPGEGGPATGVQLGTPLAVAVGPDASVYIADNAPQLGSVRVIRVTPDGIARTFAGTGPSGFTGDGGPADEARLSQIRDLVVAPDGSLYLTEFRRVRRVSPDGTITTFAGNGQVGVAGDGGPAAHAVLGEVWNVAVGGDGSLYVSGENRIRRVAPDGVITTIAGTGAINPDRPVQGVPATAASFDGVGDLAVDPDGTVYVRTGRYVHQISVEGILTTVAGQPTHGFAPDGSPASSSKLNIPMTMTLHPDGRMIVAEQHRVRAISAPFPGMGVGGMAIASEDGSEVYEFSPTGRHVRTRDALNSVVLYEFGYDAGGRLVTVRDADGLVSTIERDGSGRPTALVAPNGQRTSVALDANGFLQGLTNPAGEAFAFTYSPTGGLLTGVKDPRQNEVAGYSYDASGRLTGSTNPLGGATTVTTTAAAAGSQAVITAPGSTPMSVAYQQMPSGGQQMRIVNPDGTAIEETEEATGRHVAVTPEGVEVTTTVSADPRFGMQAPVREETVVLPSGRTRTTRSRRGIELSNAADPSTVVATIDSMIVNNRASRVRFDRTTNLAVHTSAAGRVIQQRFDSAGRPVEHVLPALTPIRQFYDARGRLERLEIGGRAQQMTYDARDRLASVTDALGRTERFAYDSANRVVAKTFANGRVVGLLYDENGNLTSVTPPSRPAHGLEYTANDQLQEYLPPSVASGAGALRFVYDSVGRVKEVHRPDSTVIGTVYEPRGRVVTTTYPDGEVLTQRTDTLTGLLATATYAAGASLAYGYDGQFPTSVTWSGAVSGTVTTTYDNDFRVQLQRVNNANTVTFTYDADGMPTQIGSLTLTRNPQSGLVSGTTLGGVTTSTTYSLHREPSVIQARFGDTVLYAVEFTRDSVGRIARKTETIGGVTSVFEFGYDSVSQLVSVTRDAVGVEAYEYDDNGNRVRATSSGGTATGIFDAQDRLTSLGAATHQYTRNGELSHRILGNDTTRLTYDARGALRSVRLADGTNISYVIDAEGRRVGKRINGVTTKAWLYESGLAIAAELSATGAVVSRFVYGERLNVPEYMVRGTSSYRLVTDQLGSVRLVVNAATGAIAQQLDYDAFGRVVQNTNPGFQPFGFAGGLYDEHTGLVRFGARDYDATTGRWTAKDPALFQGGTANLYAYVGNDPINALDPTGLYTVPELNATQVIRNILEKFGGRKAVLEIRRKAGCWAVEFITEEAIEYGIYLFLEVDLPDNDERAGRRYTGRSGRMKRRRIQHEISQRLIGQFSAVFKVMDNIPLKEAEQFVMDMVSAYFEGRFDATLYDSDDISNKMQAMNGGDRAAMRKKSSVKKKFKMCK